jgi:hypothetical protein
MASSRLSSLPTTSTTAPSHGRDDNNAHTALMTEQSTDDNDENEGKSKELLSSVPGIKNMPAPDLDEAPPASIGLPGAPMPASSTASHAALWAASTDNLYMQWTKLTALVMATINEQDRKWTNLLEEFENHSLEHQCQSEARHRSMLKRLFETNFETAIATLDRKLAMTHNTALTPV